MLFNHSIWAMSQFWNREHELKQLKAAVRKGGLAYVTGRRRIGKTALLLQACKDSKGIYHQAVQGTPAQQLWHFSQEMGEALPIFRELLPKSWSEFFSLLSREKLPPLLVIDEFPYWIEGDKNLPSLFQKWLDHELPKQKCLLVLSGSSQQMLFSQFLNQSAPLYGRAMLHLKLQAMNYHWFCRSLKYKLTEPESFEKYSLVGGVPHYWKLMFQGSLLDQVEFLYFDASAILAEEPTHLIRDEGITGTVPKAILDLVGRGVHKPSEIASRIGTAQGNLSRPLEMLTKLNLMSRDLPFGESTRTTKKVLYRLNDPALSFYYGTYLPQRSQWSTLTKTKQKTLVSLHASHQWEQYCREQYPGSARYWEANLEIDLVSAQKDGSHLIGECKWMKLKKQEEAGLLHKLQEKFYQSRLSQKLKKVKFRIFSKKDLAF
jgi:uncharacterized protein